MRGDYILLLGIGIQPPWQLVDQHLDTSKQPYGGTAGHLPCCRRRPGSYSADRSKAPRILLSTRRQHS